MKKVALLFVALLSLQMVVAQDPIMPYKKNMASYSIAQIDSLAKGDSIKSIEFREELLLRVQLGLKTAGENVVLTMDSISWILKHIDPKAVEMIIPKGSINSGWSNNNRKIYTFPTEVDWEGFVYYFRYGKCNLPQIKANCVNLLGELVTATPSSITTTPTTFGLKPAQNPLFQGLGNFSQQAIPPVNVFVTNTNTNTVDFGPLLDKLEKMNQPAPAQPAVDLKLPATVAEEKSFNPWVPIIIGGVITLGTGTALYLLLRDKGGPVGAPGHGDITGGPVGAPGHGGILKLLFRFH